MTQLMTRIPIPITIDIKNEELGKGNIYFPLIGGLIGLFLAAIYKIFFHLYGDGYLLSVLVVAAYLWISGGLHMDGLSDTFDGLWSNRSREKILEIMRDSRVGVYGVLILILTISILIGGIQKLHGQWQWLILIPMVARYGCVVGNAISEYARPEGMGKYFVKDCGLKELLVASLYTWPLAFWLRGIQGIMVVIFVLAFTYLFTHWVQAKIGGITGDVIGAVIELNQLLVLLLAVLFINLNLEGF
ncbi:cobalamin 5'-phosphate synthase [Anoxybacter fermentans]|uniref:Adenosylcobinamide-GDP ribazoletransferase n=2 Tax=Anoxybacter fermentans TaxID=1323375 RepID=A0A3Q9HV12_9FIRM|nr:cobalamin 5'-phosphate synthase [Anoxybacter fermentans]